MKNTIIIAIISSLIIGWAIGKFTSTSASDKATVSTETTHQHSDKEEIWTCSMHPQIRLPHPGKCPICGMTLILADDNKENSIALTMTKEALALMNVQTTVVGAEKPLTNTGIKLSGRIKPNETTNAKLVSHIAGRIEELYVNYIGESVSKGQKIATVYSPDLITAQKELLEAHKMKEINPQLFEATKNKLKYWKITDDQIQSIIERKTVIENFDIYSDFHGVVAQKNVEVGDHLKEGEVLFQISDLSNVWGVFDAYENQLTNIHTGDIIQFTSPSQPGTKQKGKITFIDPVLNPKTRTASVRIDISNKYNKLKPEEFIEGELLKAPTNTDTAIYVPKSAVLWTGERSVVYVKLPEEEAPTFEYREVTLGSTSGKNYQITSGLKKGEEIVVNGAFVIDASAQLNNRNSMMNKKVKVRT